MALKVVLIIVFVFQFMLHITRPLITLYGSNLGASTLEIGILTATYAFFPLLFAVHAGKITDKIGDRLPILFGMIAASVGLVFPFIFSTIWSIYVSQIIVGLAHIFIIISLQNVLGNAATKENRDHYFGLFSMVVAIAQFCGPVIGGYLAEYTSYGNAFLVSGIIGVVAIVTSFWVPIIIRTKEAAIETAKTSTYSLLKIPLLRKALVGSALVLYSRDIFIAYFPLFALQMNISDSQIGWIIALQALAMVPIRFFLGQLSILVGRARLLLTSILVAGICYILIPFTTNIYLLVGLAILMGAGLGCGQPLSMTTIYNASPIGKTGEVLGLRLASNRISQLAAPVLFGVIGSGLGLLSVFIMSGALLVGGAFYTHTKDDATEVKDARGTG